MIKGQIANIITASRIVCSVCRLYYRCGYPCRGVRATVDVDDDTASDATIAPLADTTVVDAVATPDRSTVEPISM